MKNLFASAAAATVVLLPMAAQAKASTCPAIDRAAHTVETIRTADALRIRTGPGSGAVFIYAESENCGPCKGLKPELVKRFNGKNMPTMFIVDAESKIVESPILKPILKRDKTNGHILVPAAWLFVDGKLVADYAQHPTNEFTTLIGKEVWEVWRKPQKEWPKQLDNLVGKMIAPACERK